MGLGGLVLGFPLLYLKLRIMMFQLSGFNCKCLGAEGFRAWDFKDLRIDSGVASAHIFGC